jgi:hypothetical protein
MPTWSEFEIARAKKLRNQGHTYGQIGKVLGRSASSVECAVSRYSKSGSRLDYGSETVWRCRQLIISDYSTEETAAIIGCPLEVAQQARDM